MNIDEYFDALLNADTIAINYDEICDHINPSGEPTDMLPAIAFHLSERLETPQHYARARKIVSELALICLEFNLRESSTDYAEELVELIDSEELPELTCEVSVAIY